MRLHEAEKSEEEEEEVMVVEEDFIAAADPLEQLNSNAMDVMNLDSETFGQALPSYNGAKCRLLM